MDPDLENVIHQALADAQAAGRDHLGQTELAIQAVQRVRPDMTASDALAAVNLGVARMIPDLDTCRAANLLVKHHGEDAPIHAVMRSDAMLDKGDLDGCAVWKRIVRAVEVLQREIATAGDQIH